MKITWVRYKSYDSAQDQTGVIYLHERNGIPFYWGIADKSVFGGNTRSINGEKKNPRYGRSYRHWIESCLQSGSRLYIGCVENLGNYNLEDIEAHLLKTYGSEMNEPIANTNQVTEVIQHYGNVPESILKPALSKRSVGRRSL